MNTSKRIFNLILLLSLISAIAWAAPKKNQPTESVKPNPWQQLTINDLKAIKQQIDENCVAPVSYQTDHFKQWFKPGFEKAMKRAKTVDSFQGYYYTLLYYVNGLKTPHFRLHPIFTLKSSQHVWPHFTLGYRNGKYMVIFHDDPEDNDNYFPIPPEGAELLSCNGVPAAKLFKQQVWPLMYSERKTEWRKVEHAPQLFLDDGNPWFKMQKQCVFKIKGKEVNYHLYWRKFQENEAVLETLKNEAALNIRKQDYAIEKFTKNGLWIRIPDFNEEPWARKIAKAIAPYRKKDIIVFDMRGNHGGKTNYGRHIIKNLYGVRYLKSLGNRFYLNRKWIEEMRVSSKNIRYIKRQGDNFKKLAADMAHAKLNKQSIVLDKEKPNDITLSKDYKANNPVTAKVFVVERSP